MIYSKRVTELQRIYSLNPEDVFFCMLVASGATRQEAYAAIYRPTTNGTGTIASKATALQNSKPGIAQLIEAIQYQRAGAPTKTGSPKEDTANIAEGNKRTEIQNAPGLVLCDGWFITPLVVCCKTMFLNILIQ